MATIGMVLQPFLTCKSLATIFASKWSLTFVYNHNMSFQVSKAIKVMSTNLAYMILSFMDASHMIYELWLSFEPSATYFTTMWSLLFMNQLNVRMQPMSRSESTGTL